MSAPLEWMKLYHSHLMGSLKWRAVPAAHKGVFLDVLMLAGMNGNGGFVDGNDTAIASRLGYERRLVKAAIDRFVAVPWQSLGRTAAGVTVVNWPKYQQSSPVEEIREEQEKITLKTLPEGREWWDALAKKYPSIDLLAELQKAGEWHGANKVKSPRLYFRNWVARAKPEPREFDLPDLSVSEARIG